MKQNYEQLSNFISLNRSFFEDALLPEINAGSKQYSWESQTWTLGGGILRRVCDQPSTNKFCASSRQ